jgi:transposase
MAHARRKFNEALDKDEARANYALQEIQKLDAIERFCKEQALTEHEIFGVRQQQSLPILIALGNCMKKQYAQGLQRSVIADALAYSIRPVALGRENYLFAGSHEAAKRSGMLYSLLGTCKMHGIEPAAWLRDVLKKIPSHPINKIKDVLPQKEQLAEDKSKPSHRTCTGPEGYVEVA